MEHLLWGASEMKQALIGSFLLASFVTDLIALQFRKSGSSHVQKKKVAQSKTKQTVLLELLQKVLQNYWLVRCCLESSLLCFFKKLFHLLAKLIKCFMNCWLCLT